MVGGPAGRLDSGFMADGEPVPLRPVHGTAPIIQAGD